MSFLFFWLNFLLHSWIQLAPGGNHKPWPVQERRRVLANKEKDEEEEETSWKIHLSYISNKLFNFRHILQKHSLGQNALPCSSPALPLPLFISSSLHLPLHYIFQAVLPVNSRKWTISVQKNLFSGCTRSSSLWDRTVSWSGKMGVDGVSQ